MTTLARRYFPSHLETIMVLNWLQLHPIGQKSKNKNGSVSANNCMGNVFLLRISPLTVTDAHSYVLLLIYTCEHENEGS